MFLLGACVLVDIWMFLVLSDLIGVFDRAQQGRLGSRSDLDAITRVDTAEKLGIGSVLVTAVAFLYWYSCAYKQSARVGAGTMRHSHGWAIGSWFVPFLNLVRPKQITDDLWRASDPDRYAGHSATVSPVVHCWWAALLIAALLERIAFAQVRSVDRDAEQAVLAQDLPGVLSAMESFSSAVSLTRVAFVVDLVAAILAILVVRGITERLTERDRTAAVDPVAPFFGGGAPVPPTWSPAPAAPMLAAPPSPPTASLPGAVTGARTHSIPPPPKR